MPLLANSQIDEETGIKIEDAILLIDIFALEETEEIRQGDVPYEHILFALWKKGIVEGRLFIREGGPEIGLLNYPYMILMGISIEDSFKENRTFLKAIFNAVRAMMGMNTKEEEDKTSRAVKIVEFVTKEFYKNSFDEKKKKLDEFRKTVREMVACRKNGELDKWWAGELKALLED